MQYGKYVHNISLEKDVYAEQFADTRDIKTNYIVNLWSGTLEESEDPQALAKRLRNYAKRLTQIATF